MQFIDLKAQYRALKDEINANVQSVMDSAAFIAIFLKKIKNIKYISINKYQKKKIHYMVLKV